MESGSMFDVEVDCSNNAEQELAVSSKRWRSKPSTSTKLEKAMNCEINTRFLAAVTIEAKTEILGTIADHYGITPQQAYDEVTAGEAEHLLDYLTSSYREATSVLMQAHGFHTVIR